MHLWELHPTWAEFRKEKCSQWAKIGELDTQLMFSRDGYLPGLRQRCYLRGGSRDDGEGKKL